MYGFGDDQNPYSESVDLLEDLVIEYTTEMVSGKKYTCTARNDFCQDLDNSVQKENTVVLATGLIYCQKHTRTHNFIQWNLSETTLSGKTIFPFVKITIYHWIPCTPNLSVLRPSVRNDHLFLTSRLVIPDRFHCILTNLRKKYLLGNVYMYNILHLQGNLKYECRKWMKQIWKKRKNRTCFKKILPVALDLLGGA